MAQAAASAGAVRPARDNPRAQGMCGSSGWQHAHSELHAHLLPCQTRVLCGAPMHACKITAYACGIYPGAAPLVAQVSWNIGMFGLKKTLRRCFNNSLAELLRSLDADIICFQETKLGRGEADRDLALADGWSVGTPFCCMLIWQSFLLQAHLSDQIRSFAKKKEYASYICMFCLGMHGGVLCVVLW